jgi:hypothetical protein
MDEPNQIAFTEEAARTQFTGVAPKKSLLNRIAYGLGAKTDEQATFVLCALAAVIAIAAAIVFVIGQPHPPAPLTPDSPLWPPTLNHG